MNFRIVPTALVRKDLSRRIDVTGTIKKAAKLKLVVSENGAKIAESDLFLAGSCGEKHPSTASVWLSLPSRDIDAVFVIYDLHGSLLAEIPVRIKRPRDWTLFIMVSSHTDIGLHNSQYIQRYNSSKFTDMAAELCDRTKNRPDEDRYHYIMEGSWFFSNYAADRGDEAAAKLLDDYIRPGRIGVCAGVAGNHTQTYNHEELCRSAYSRQYLEERGVSVRTMTMIDNNGISPAIIQPYADAGIENIIFAPNQWNPIPSSVWKRDHTIPAYTWNPEAGGGGSRIDVRYASDIPMLFRWRGVGNRELLVWASTQYEHGGYSFGLSPEGEKICVVEDRMASELALLEEKYPYNVWLFASYSDDQAPDIRLCDTVAEWNREFLYPRLRLAANPDEPFDIIRSSFYDSVPVLTGDITGGWYQHPLSAAELLAEKNEAGRRLETAEKVSVIAALRTGYAYPESDFGRAYAALVMNDEHSYGTSGYQGRRVYETWMQHRDWIQYAMKVADTGSECAMHALAESVSGNGERVIVFNPMGCERNEIITSDYGKCVAKLAPFGWTTIRRESFIPANSMPEDCDTPPTIENDYYRVEFAENGSVALIFDKELGRRLNSAPVNRFLYTKDNHITFASPEKAAFRVKRDMTGTTVISSADDEVSGARIVSEVFLPDHEKRIDIDDHIEHLTDMFNNDRYKRYAYLEFGFDVPRCRRYCDLGGVEGEYGVYVTGHGTDAYMAAHEYCAIDSEEGFGIGLVQLDSELVEFDHIHPDKTVYGAPGDGSALFSYLANDWLQMHVSGGDELNFRFRYVITSYRGDHRSSGLARLAERVAAKPLVMTVNNTVTNGLPESASFIQTTDRLISVKKSRGSDGVSVRVLTHDTFSRRDVGRILATTLGKAELTSVDETEYKGKDNISGYVTFAIKDSKPRVRRDTIPDELEIGGGCDGLMYSPRAASGEERGMLYLLWGRCRTDAEYYELYRSEKSGFVPEESGLIAKVKPEEYVVGRYVDTGLRDQTVYFYRVRAVAHDGRKGEFSEEFSGSTAAPKK